LKESGHAHGLKQGGTMENHKPGIRSIDAYIKNCPEEVRKDLRALREVIKAAAPEAEERISYRMPAFWFKGYLAFFAAFKNHIGFYPTASGIQAFEKKLSGYPFAKGSVQFPIGKPLPLPLISKIVKFKLHENIKNEKAKNEKAKVNRRK
jgi:uncharacterized protein YdhG (YjbR/CyaY superfamily)